MTPSKRQPYRQVQFPVACFHCDMLVCDVPPDVKTAQAMFEHVPSACIHNGLVNKSYNANGTFPALWGGFDWSKA
jgi:hypothetical protein